MTDFEYDVINRLSRIEERLANALKLQDDLSARIAVLEKRNGHEIKKWLLIGVIVASIVGGTTGASLLELLARIL